MWLFTVHGFFSVVKKDKNLVKIRSHEQHHLERLKRNYPSLQDFEIIHTPDSNYSFRIIVPHVTWSWVAKDLSRDVDYENFKGVVKEWQGPTKYERALHEVWGTMARTQPIPPYSKLQGQQ